jgi:hypothetical protein
MQVPTRLESFDLRGFSAWLRKNKAYILKTDHGSACVINFFIIRKNHAANGAVWCYEGSVEYFGVARKNYALFLLKSKPWLDRKNAVEMYKFPFKILAQVSQTKSGSNSALRKKRILKEYLLQRDGVLCFYCAQTMSREDTTIEHLVAKFHGGTDEMTNLVLAHGACNTKVGILPLHEKLQLRHRMRRPKNVGA